MSKTWNYLGALAAVLLLSGSSLAFGEDKPKPEPEEVFKKLDKDGDGKVSLAEFTTYEERTFERMDKNGDGVITRDEMTSRRSYASRSSNRT